MLDLDHTLLNSAIYAELSPEVMEKLAAQHEKEWAGEAAQARAAAIVAGPAKLTSSPQLTPSPSPPSPPLAAVAAPAGAEVSLGGGGDGGGGAATMEVEGEALSTAPAATAAASSSSAAASASDALPLLHHLPHLGMWTKLRPGAAPHLHSPCTLPALSPRPLPARSLHLLCASASPRCTSPHASHTPPPHPSRRHLRVPARRRQPLRAIRVHHGRQAVRRGDGTNPNPHPHPSP